MVDILDWCLLLGVSEYSILMFSFGNYYRPKDEVDHWVVVLRFYLKKLIINWCVDSPVYRYYLSPPAYKTTISNNLVDF